MRESIDKTRLCLSSQERVNVEPAALYRHFAEQKNKKNTSVELAGMLLPELQLIYQMDRPMSRPVEKNIFFTSFPEGSLISGLLRQWITRTAGKGRLKVKKYFFSRKKKQAHPFGGLD